MANGYLQRPKLPGITGIQAYGGHTFHTSRWDYDYTGEDLSGLADKRVGLIGTGATAVQCVPHLAAAAKHLSVFQRTPSTVDVRGNQPTDTTWASGLEPGWQRRRIENFQILTAGGECDEDLVGDAWTSITKLLVGQRAGAPEMADFAKMEQIRAQGRRHRRRPRHRRGAEAVVRLLLQAPLLPRRVPAGLQPRKRRTGGYPRTGRRAHHRVGRHRRRHRTPSGLPHLRDGFRGGHGLLPEGWLRGHRSRRSDTNRNVARRCAHVARSLRPRLPELLRTEHRAIRLHGELPVSARRPGDPRRVGDRVGTGKRRGRAGGGCRCRGGVGRHRNATIDRERRPSEVVHAGVLQPRGRVQREDAAGKLLLRWANRIRRDAASMARRRAPSRGSRSTRQTVWVAHDREPITDRGDHRGRVRRHGRRGGASKSRHRRSHHHRAVRRRRRNLAVATRIPERHATYRAISIRCRSRRIRSGREPMLASRRYSPTSSRSPTNSSCAAT